MDPVWGSIALLPMFSKERSTMAQFPDETTGDGAFNWIEDEGA